MQVLSSIRQCQTQPTPNTRCLTTTSHALALCCTPSGVRSHWIESEEAKKPWQTPAEKAEIKVQSNPNQILLVCVCVCVPEQSSEVTVSLEETPLRNLKVEKKRLKQHFLL